jgi:GH35 family endo-1,4-beta-xylanase
MISMAKGYHDINYEKCKYMVEFAKNNSQAFRAHNLIWPSPGKGHNPEFIKDEKNTHKKEAFMLEYINKTVKTIGHYPVNWDVINEAVSDTNDTKDPIYPLKHSDWSDIDDLICKAFKAARDASAPNQKLYYNDYGHASMSWAKSTRVFDMVSKMKERGEEECPIDGVGF